MAEIPLDQLPENRPATLVGVATDAGDASAAAVARGDSSDQSVGEIARRLIELGCVRGERVRVIRRFRPGGDPIAVRIGSLTLALRRFEARLVTVLPD